MEDHSQLLSALTSSIQQIFDKVFPTMVSHAAQSVATTSPQVPAPHAEPRLPPSAVRWGILRPVGVPQPVFPYLRAPTILISIGSGKDCLPDNPPVWLGPCLGFGCVGGTKQDLLELLNFRGVQESLRPLSQWM